VAIYDSLYATLFLSWVVFERFVLGLIGLVEESNLSSLVLNDLLLWSLSRQLCA